MDMQPQGMPGPIVTPVAPPTEPVPLGRVKPASSWPSLLGVLAVVFGALGALSGAWTAISPFFMNLMEGFMSKVPQASSSFAVMHNWEWWFITSGVMTLALAVVLLAGGIGLLRRRRRAVTLLLWWAVLKIVWTIVSTGVGIPMQLQNLEATRAGMSQQNAAAASMMGPMKYAVIGATAVAILWLIALPVAMLIVLTRPGVKAEYRGWETTPPGA